MNLVAVQQEGVTCDLGSLADINSSSIGRDYPYTEIEYIDISSVGSGTQSAPTKYQFADAPGRARRLVAHGDTLLATVRPNLRSFLFVKRPSKRTVASTGFAVLRPKKGVDARFLYYTVTNHAFTEYLTLNAKGSAYPAVDVDTIKRAEVFCPSLPTQRKIAAVLSAYDDLIENNTRRIQILEEMAQALYREWFVHFRFPGHEQSKMVESALGPIPEGWEATTIGSAINITGGGTPSTTNPEFWTDGTVTWFSPSDLTASKSMFIKKSEKMITPLGLQKSSARLFPPYCVMMTSRATIGVVSINTTEACTNQGFITCVPSERISAYQLYFWVKENRDKIISVASGATFKEINKATFRNLPIVIADFETASRLEQTVGPFGKQIENLLLKNINLRKTRDLLLPKLISGEVDVSELEIDSLILRQ